MTDAEGALALSVQAALIYDSVAYLNFAFNIQVFLNLN